MLRLRKIAKSKTNDFVVPSENLPVHGKYVILFLSMFNVIFLARSYDTKINRLKFFLISIFDQLVYYKEMSVKK